MRFIIALFMLMISCPFSLFPITETTTPPDEFFQFAVLQSASALSQDELLTASEVIMQRLDALGVAAIVETEGSQCLLLQLNDTEQLFSIISDTLLEFVDFTDVPDANALVGQVIATTSRPDAGVVNPVTGAPFQTILTGEAIQFAEAQQSDFGDWLIYFELTEDAGEAFAAYTEAHIGDALAIVLNGEVLSAPIIQGALGREGVISGNFMQEEAQTIALQLNTGLLPAPFELTAMGVMPVTDDLLSGC